MDVMTEGHSGDTMTDGLGGGTNGQRSTAVEVHITIGAMLMRYVKAG